MIENMGNVLRIAMLHALLLFLQCATSSDSLTGKVENAGEEKVAVADKSKVRDVLQKILPQKILAVLAESYPGRVADVAFVDGNWSVMVNGRRIYWMNGRMLSADSLKDWGKYSAYSFRPYRNTESPITVLNKEKETRLLAWIDKREALKDGLAPDFMAALWGMESSRIGEITVQKVGFLNKNMRVHPEIIKPVLNIEKAIREKMKVDSELRSWIGGMRYFGAYYWRDIAGSANRSMHSYGLAIDFIARNYREKHVYWRWSRDVHERWWEIPHSMRYKIPEAVVRVFEDNGFIWGGRWLLFDQIHFEYRPDLILLGKARQDRPGKTSVK